MMEEDNEDAYLLQYSNCSQAAFGLNSNCTWTVHANSTGGWHTRNESFGMNGSRTEHCLDAHPEGSGALGDGSDLFQFIVLGIGISVVAILGIVGNGLSAIVLSRPQMKCSVTCLLLGLTFCDTLLISISILTYSMPFMSSYIRSNLLLKYSHLYYPALAPYLYATSITAQTASVYLTVAVTIERYIAVCHSLQARSICTWRRARTCVLTVLIFSIVYNLPRWFEVITVQDECAKLRNITIYENQMSDLRGNEYYIKFYINWAYCIIMYLIPFSGLVVFNFAIYRQVRIANRERAQLSKLQKREMGLASMLLIVVLVFLLCNILPLVNNVLESIFQIEVDELIALSNFLVVLNSSVNFVIYCTCGERFRKLLLRLSRDFIWCRMMKGRRGSNGFHRKSNYYRSQHGGDCEEMSLASVATHTCLTTNGASRNGTVLVDLSADKVQRMTRNTYRERNRTVPTVHDYGSHHRPPPTSNHNGTNGKLHHDRRTSSTTSGPV